MGKPAGSAALSFIVLVGLTLLVALAGYVGYNYIETPLLTDVSPNPARPADTVSLKGDRFSSELGGNVVLFGDKIGRVQRATQALLEVRVPDMGLAKGGEVRVPVRVVSRGRISEAVDLSVMATSVVVHVEEVFNPFTKTNTARPAAPKSPSAPAAAVGPPAPETPASPPPSPRAPASPAPAPTHAPRVDVAGLLAEADSAAGANRFEVAADLYEKVLAADPANARAKSGQAAARAAAASWKRGFNAGKTHAEGRVARDKLKEFDGVSMKKPPEVPAQIEFEASPAHLKAGDGYSVKVFLRNAGKKAIRIGGLIVTTAVNGAQSAATPAARVEDVPPGQRAWIHEMAGTWTDGVASWALGVEVASRRGDTYRNQLTWE